MILIDFESMISKETDLISRITALLADRQKHVEAISIIDAALLKIAEILAAAGDATQADDGKASRSNPTDSTLEKPRKYCKLERTAVEFVLDLLRLHGSATALEINQAWRVQGRGGVANNTVGRLLTEGLIVREKVEGQRGSRYRLSPKSRGTSNTPQP